MAVVDARRFDILLIHLDPTQGSEIKKTRPYIVISPDEINKHIKTLIIAPITSQIKDYKTRIPVCFDDKDGSIVLDQIRTIDKRRIIKKLGVLDNRVAENVLKVLGQMFG